MRSVKKINQTRLVIDGLLLGLSVVLAIVIVKTNIVHSILESLRELEYVVIILAGMLFTSVFTTAPSVAILGEFSQSTSPWIVALLGGFGAMCGDVVLFFFVRDRVSKDLEYLLRLPRAKRAIHIFNTILPKMVWPFFGALIIASPLPDEIGIMMMGLSKMDHRIFLPLSFVLNGIGILLIGLAFRTAL